MTAPRADGAPADQTALASGALAVRWAPLARVQLLAVAAFIVLTLALTWPIPLNLSTQVPGGGDAWQHIWNLWWVKQALLVEHTNPYHTDLIYYPNGANLYFHTLVLTAGLIGIPLQVAGLNLIATYNVVILLTFVLSGYGAFLLCYYLTRQTWASFVGGLVFAFSPYHFAHLFGHMNLASLQWIPFYALTLLLALDAPAEAKRRGLLLAALAGGLLAVNAYTDWLYGIFMGLFTAFVIAWRLLAPTARRAQVEGSGWTQAALRVALLAVTFLALMSPVLFATLAEARQGYAQQPPQETLVYSSDAVMAFMPSELHPLWGKEVAERVDHLGPYLPIKNPSERVVFLGYAVLALAALGVWRSWKRGAVRFWAAIAVLSWLLSLGPVLQLAGRTSFTAFGVTVPLPYLLLYKLPLMSIMRTPARLTVLTMLALATLVAFALAHLLARREGHAPWWQRPGTAQAALAVLAPALILFEYLALPFPMVPPGWGVPIYEQIAREPGRFALLELPLRPFGDYMAYQTVHGKPIIGGYLSRQPPYELLDREPVLRYLLDSTAPDDPLREQVRELKGERALRDLSVKYVIIRWWAFTPEQKVAMQAKLSALFERTPDLTYPADKVDAWQLSP